MYISSGVKKSLLGVAVLAILGGAAAYVFLDPFAEKPKPVVVVPKPQARAVQPVVKTPVVLPAAVPAPPAAEPAATVVVTPAVTPAQADAAATKPDITPATPVQEIPAQEIQPSLKFDDSIKQAGAKPVSPPSVDLRYCLDQPTNQEIAKCAGE